MARTLALAAFAALARLTATGLAATWLVVTVATAAAASPASERTCLALLAYAEAAGDGARGMDAVIRVVRNRMADARFPSSACAVGLQRGQFQPIDEDIRLRRLLMDPRPDGLARALRVDTAWERDVLEEAERLARASGGGTDPTVGALYFVNPRFMDPRKCPWFATLKRTRAIGGHVFMTHWRSHETERPAALDCNSSEIGAGFAAGLRAGYRTGLFAPGGPSIATRTPTRRMLEAWRRTGQLEQRERALKRMFEPGWLTGEPK